MKKWACCIFFLLICVSYSIYAQNRNTIDSLKLEIEIVTTPSKKVPLLLLASKAAQGLSSPEEAFKFATSALDIATREGLKKQEVLAMYEIASIHNSKNEFKEAFRIATEAKKIADKNSFEIESGEISLFLAQMYFVIGEYDKSVALSFNLLKVFKENKKYEEQARCLEMIGRNYAVLGKDSLGRDYFSEAIKISKAHKVFNVLGVAIGNLAHNYGLNEQYTKAIELHKQGCDILLAHQKNAPAIGTGYCNIAMYYLENKQIDSSLVYLQKAEKFNTRINNNRNIFATHSAYAKYYRHIDDTPNFLKHAKIAFSLSEENNFKFEQVGISEMLEKYYIDINDYKNAYYYKNVLFELEKKIDAQKVLMKLGQLEMTKELEIAENKEALQKRKQTLINIIIFVALLFLIILLFISLRNYRTKVRFSKLKVEKLNDEISFKNKEMIIHLMDLSKRNELLAEITKKLISVSKEAKKEETKNAINKIAIDIEKATEAKIWEEFIIRFKEVHSNFYDNLIAKYPNLSPNEQRLCAFLKLNLTTKEISTLTGQVERTIVMSRYRLRKKLGIESKEVNLTSFISKI